MPPKKKTYERALAENPWTFDIVDDCLFEMVQQAIVAKNTALRKRAFECDPCREIMRKADESLSAIESGFSTGVDARRAALSALRKFSAATECAHWRSCEHGQRSRRKTQ